jgi:cell division septum initiation protein DivIVA
VEQKEKEMGEEIKDVNKKIDDMDAAVKKYASKDTVISIGGYEFTPAKLMVAATIVSSVLGGLYGAFEVYKDYQSMKKKIAEYVTPDLTEIYKKLELVQQSSEKGTQYTQDIKNDLKQDIRRLENVVEQVERSAKQMQREVNQAQKEQDAELRQVRREVDDKIKKALDNPLAGK